MLWLFQFEQSFRNADDPQNLHQQSIAQATVVYYCSRMEAVSLVSRQTYRVQLWTGAESCAQAWKEGNDSVAQYMLRNITGKFVAVQCQKRASCPSDRPRKQRGTFSPFVRA